MIVAPETVAAVAIGRNEGERLKRCLSSLSGLSVIVYVDSGSDDGSVDAACAAGAEVVELDMSLPFTAARARNAGLAHLRRINPDVEFIQFLDGDCELVEGWIAAAHAEMETDDSVAIVCGRRREKCPEASIWNRMIDHEWDTPVGDARDCGGDALIRRTALDEVGGYRETLIAGEEPEMCYRLRQRGWRIRRIDADMTLHDAALSRFGQWWQRCRRAGHAYAECAALHGHGPERFRVAESWRALIWGLGLPFFAIIGATIWSPLLFLVLLGWPLQMLRLLAKGNAAEDAVFLTLGKLPEAQGITDYWRNRLLGRRGELIEYK
jgi:GT2 family glycosyltransferase